MRQLSSRMQNLNAMCLVSHQLIDKEDEGGVVKPGLFNLHTPTFGPGSFDHGNEDRRWDHLLSTGYPSAQAFQDEHARHKAINLDLRSKVVLTPGSPPLKSIFDEPIGGFGAKSKKIQKAVMDEREDFNIKVIQQRMCSLPYDDHRRKAWLEVHGNEFATLLGRPEVVFSANRWYTAVAIHFGVPVMACIRYIGSRIKTGGSQNQVVDAHGHHLLSLTHSFGGGTSALHNSLISAVSHSLELAGVYAKSKGVNNGVTNVFKDALSGGHPLGENGNNKINGIIPDMVLRADGIEDSGAFGSPLGGRTHLIDFKTHASTSDHNSESTVCGHVGKIRQEKVNAAYHKTAADLDALVHDTPPGVRGPVQRKLREYGNDGRVLGPIIGVYGSGSNDLKLLRDLAASELARKHLEYHNMEFFHARAMFRNKLSRSWGQRIARGWASMLLDRLRDYVIPASNVRPTYSDYYGPNSNETNDQFNYFHTLMRGSSLNE